MQHIINLAIDVEDERIVKSIEQNVEDKVIASITKTITDRLVEKDWYGRVKSYRPLDDMVANRIDSILADHKDLIIETAATKLAEKIARSKAGKAILENVSQEEA